MKFGFEPFVGKNKYSTHFELKNKSPTENWHGNKISNYLHFTATYRQLFSIRLKLHVVQLCHAFDTPNEVFVFRIIYKACVGLRKQQQYVDTTPVKSTLSPIKQNENSSAVSVIAMSNHKL